MVGVIDLRDEEKCDGGMHVDSPEQHGVDVRPITDLHGAARRRRRPGAQAVEGKCVVYGLCGGASFMVEHKKCSGFGQQ